MAGKKPIGDKTLVDAAFSEKALSISQINCITKSSERGGKHLGPVPLQHQEDEVDRWHCNVFPCCCWEWPADDSSWPASWDCPCHPHWQFGFGEEVRPLGPQVVVNSRKRSKWTAVETSWTSFGLTRQQPWKYFFTMDKLAVSFHTQETKKQSMQWVKKGQQSPRQNQSLRDKNQENGPSLLWCKGHNRNTPPRAQVPMPNMWRRPWLGFWSFSGRRDSSRRPTRSTLGRKSGSFWWQKGPRWSTALPFYQTLPQWTYSSSWG